MAKTTITMCVLFFFASLSVTEVTTAEPDVRVETLSTPDACSAIAAIGDTISMRYRGNLYDVATKQAGKEFDSNFDSPQTFDFKLGAGQVIQGWEKGIPGMCVGERRKLIIPPELAYGDDMVMMIPPKSTLVFEIELVSVKPGDEDDHTGPDHNDKEETFRALDTNGDKQITKEEMAGFIKKLNDEGSEEPKIEDIEAVVNRIFQGDDKDKDGVISYEEYEKMGEGRVDEGGQRRMTKEDDEDQSWKEEL